LDGGQKSRRRRSTEGTSSGGRLMGRKEGSSGARVDTFDAALFKEVLAGFGAEADGLEDGRVGGKRVGVLGVVALAADAERRRFDGDEAVFIGNGLLGGSGVVLGELGKSEDAVHEGAREVGELSVEVGLEESLAVGREADGVVAVGDGERDDGALGSLDRGDGALGSKVGAVDGLVGEEVLGLDAEAVGVKGVGGRGGRRRGSSGCGGGSRGLGEFLDLGENVGRVGEVVGGGVGKHGWGR